MYLFVSLFVLRPPVAKSTRCAVASHVSQRPQVTHCLVFFFRSGNALEKLTSEIAEVAAMCSLTDAFGSVAVGMQ